MTDVSNNGENGGYESSSYSFVGVSEQGSIPDLVEDASEHAIAQTGVFPDDTLVINPFFQLFLTLLGKY